MELLLLRHGPAGDRAAFARSGRPDAERPLTPEGRKAAKKAAVGLRAVFPGVRLVASSPLARALQTAEFAAKAYEARLVEWPELAPGGDSRALARRIARLPRRGAALLVGHEPDLGALAGRLLGGPPLELKKAGACLLELPGRDPARLRWLLEPSHLRALRHRR